MSLNLTAPDGYVISNATYTPEGGTATEIVPANGVYSFTMPNANVIINASLIAEYTLDVAGYGNSDGGYVLIASPVGTVSPENVDNMLSNAYDLYRFDQNGDAQGNEWINYKGDANDNMGGFNLEIGKGYLYAHSSDITLNFIGTPIENTTYDVTLRMKMHVSLAGTLWVTPSQELLMSTTPTMHIILWMPLALRSYLSQAIPSMPWKVSSSSPLKTTRS